MAAFGDWREPRQKSLSQNAPGDVRELPRHALGL
jgi:hypothetical protein